ncbi:MAG TPA: hypothetical protein VMS11_14250 [Solirubrobacterales bacterium]|nr:hypothetical protein [Solirubrobacterales bacterium]
MHKLKGRRGVAVAAVAVAGVAALAGIAGAASKNKPVTVRVGDIEVIADGGFKPEVMSKTTPTPISFFAKGTIKSINPEKPHPPALQKVLVETDKNGSVFVKGYPVCRSGQLQSQNTKNAEDVCRPAIIGEGQATAEIAFVDSKSVPVSSKVIVFNGGERAGVITFYIHAYITIPVPAAIVTTVKIEKIHNGRYGYLSTATIPKIAGGAGSLTSFSLKIGKRYTYKGKKVSILYAKCPDGKLQANVTGFFSDDTEASAEVARTCTGKG